MANQWGPYYFSGEGPALDVKAEIAINGEPKNNILWVGNNKAWAGGCIKKNANKIRQDIDYAEMFWYFPLDCRQSVEAEVHKAICAGCGTPFRYHL